MRSGGSDGAGGLAAQRFFYSRRAIGVISDAGDSDSGAFNLAVGAAHHRCYAHYRKSRSRMMEFLIAGLGPHGRGQANFRNDLAWFERRGEQSRKKFRR